MDIERLIANVMVVDTETTGPEPKDAQLIELACGRYNMAKSSWEPMAKLFNPGCKIPPEASAVNCISNRMVANKLMVSEEIGNIRNMLSLDIAGTVYVAHNAEFDRKVLENTVALYLPDNEAKHLTNKENWICTWRLAKAIFGINYSEMKYSQNYLRYFLDLQVDDSLVPHRADADVIVCGELFLRLLTEGVDKGIIINDQNVLSQIQRLCWQPIEIKTFPFGKYRGVLLSDIPNDYYIWAIKNIHALQESHSDYDMDLAASVAKILELRLAAVA